jgi:hypothetical protein
LDNLKNREKGGRRKIIKRDSESNREGGREEGREG